MKLTSIGLIASGLMLVASTAGAAPLTSSPSTGIGGTTPNFQFNPGLPPATPEENTGRALGTIPPQSPILPDTSGNLPETSGGFSVSPNTSGTGLLPPRGGG
jgi:hypothetical protein